MDADVLAYRSAWSENTLSEETALLKLDELIGDILQEVDPYGTKSNQKYFLTGRGNFRHDIAKTAVYKGNRKDTEKPIHLAAIRNYLITKYDAHISDGNEADDMIGIYANMHGYGNVVIVSVDKDFEQIPTTIFNPTKWTWKTVEPWGATKNFYKQILTGDRVDNIMGIMGVGPVKAERILEGCDSEKSLFWACVEAYSELDKYDDTLPEDRVVENARLLYIQRNYDELWEPPI